MSRISLQSCNQSHLKGIGFKSSNDQGVIPLLKDLGFLEAGGTPTKRYHNYRDQSKSGQVLGDALQGAYEDIFHINEKPSENDRKAIEGRFKSVHNTSDAVASRQAMTFLALLKLADISGGPPKKVEEVVQEKIEEVTAPRETQPAPQIPTFAGLRYNIEIHLPATKDVEVYNAIFKSLKDHLLDD